MYAFRIFSFNGGIIQQGVKCIIHSATKPKSVKVGYWGTKKPNPWPPTVFPKLSFACVCVCRVSCNYIKLFLPILAISIGSGMWDFAVI